MEDYIRPHWKWTNNNIIPCESCECEIFYFLSELSKLKCELIPPMPVALATEKSFRRRIDQERKKEKKRSKCIKLNQSNFERNGPWTRCRFFLLLSLATAQPSHPILSRYELRFKCTAPRNPTEHTNVHQQWTRPCERIIPFRRNRCECEVVRCDSLYNRFKFHHPFRLYVHSTQECALATKPTNVRTNVHIIIKIRIYAMNDSSTVLCEMYNIVLVFRCFLLLFDYSEKPHSSHSARLRNWVTLYANLHLGLWGSMSSPSVCNSCEFWNDWNE